MSVPTVARTASTTHQLMGRPNVSLAHQIRAMKAKMTGFEHEADEGGDLDGRPRTAARRREGWQGAWRA